MELNQLFNDYELLLPTAYDGGYLLLTLYQRIQDKELSEQFSAEDIKLILEDIARQNNQPATPHAERIIQRLLHYCIRNVPDEYGKFELTEHANRLVDFLYYRLQNPYKNYPLRQTFEKYFVLRTADHKSIDDLETRFGKDFVYGHKRIIQDHLGALEGELADAYQRLNTILHSDEESATTMVRQFVLVFSTFGERAEDISLALASKDNFLRRLRDRAESFYQEADALKQAQTEDELFRLRQHQNDWLRAVTILNDLERFFKGVDDKISRIRRQILKASTKLSELQENFSRRSNFRLMVKKLYHACLEQAFLDDNRLQFKPALPLKSLVYEKIQLFFPVYYTLGSTKDYRLRTINANREYELSQRREIEKEIKRQEIINRWVEEGRMRLAKAATLDLSAFLGEVLQAENDLHVAQSVAIDLSNNALDSEQQNLIIQQFLHTFSEHHLHIWQMKIEKTTTAS